LIENKVNTDIIFDDREILGLSGNNKLRLIVKIQALIRGYIVRKKRREAMGFEPLYVRNNNFGYSLQPNYDNRKVKSIREKLGPFNYEPRPTRDRKRRE